MLVANEVCNESLVDSDDIMVNAHILLDSPSWADQSMSFEALRLSDQPDSRSPSHGSEVHHLFVDKNGLL